MTIYLDIETTTFFQDPEIKELPRADQLKAMRFGCAVTYNAAADEWLEWDSAADLYCYIVGSPTMLLGWNIADFDWPVIRSNVQPAILSDESRIEQIDLFAEIRRTTGRWYKLEDVCQATLGRGKLADGQKAAEWLRSGDPDLVRKALDYCRHDVELTVSLHSRLLGGDPLILPPRAARQELNEIRWWLDRYERIPDASGAVSTR